MYFYFKGSVDLLLRLLNFITISIFFFITVITLKLVSHSSGYKTMTKWFKHPTLGENSNHVQTITRHFSTISLAL